MGKGPSVSQEWAEMGRHSSGGAACVTTVRGRTSGHGQRSGKDSGSRRLQSGVLAGKQGYLAEKAWEASLAGGPTPASAWKERQVCGSLQSMLKREVGVEDQAEPGPEAAPRLHEGTRVSPGGATETGFFRSSATGMGKTPARVWRVDRNAMPTVLICKMETASFKAVGRDRFCISTRRPKHSVGSLHTLPVPPPVAEATMQARWENRGP